MKLNLQEIRKKPRIEMLPLIDIVFLLLVFFIYAMLSMAVHRGISVDLPAATSAGITRDTLLTVTLRGGGANGETALFVGKEAVSLSSLEKYLRVLAHDDLEQEVLLAADRGVPYEKVFEALDRIRSAGLHRVSLQASRLSEP